MPRAKRVCPTLNCFELTDGGRCPACRRRAEQVRGTPAQRGYDEAWARRRRAFLNQPGNQRCDCGQPATVADHHPVSRRDLVAAGVPDPDADHRLVPRCKSCHDKLTSRLQPGGWNMR